jgi:phosphatidylinositol glycan class Z
VLSAVSGISLLSIFPHQEARFLIPAVPLVLCSITLPRNRISNKLWVTSWIIFNVLFGALFGVFHQGGVIPAQIFLGATATTPTTAIWWKTYSPPTWLLGTRNGAITTVDLMGSNAGTLIKTLKPLASCSQSNYLVAPLSATALDGFTYNATASAKMPFLLEKHWEYRNHLNLDDLDFREDGYLPTLSRVLGRRGLVVWKIRRPDC